MERPEGNRASENHTSRSVPSATAEAADAGLNGRRVRSDFLRDKIEAASTEAELRPVVHAYLGVLAGVPDDHSWGGLQPDYVHLSPNHSKNFAWDGDYSRLTVQPPFKALVTKRLGWADSSLAHEFKGYTLFECPNEKCEADNVYLPMISTGPFHPWQSKKHSDRALGHALTVLEWLHRNTPATHAQFVCLTAPGWVSKDLLKHDTLARFERAVSYFLKLLHAELFPRKKSSFGAMFVIHTWRSKHPLEKHLHAHLVLPNVAYNSNDGRHVDVDHDENSELVPGFHRFKPFLDDGMVKAVWRAALIRVGLWDPMDPSLPDVHLDYVSINPWHKKDRPRLVHHLRYIARRPLADLNEFLTQGDVERLDLDEKFANFLLGYVPRRHRLGWLTNLKRFGLLSRKSSKPRCPICGFEMSKIGTVLSNLPRIPHYFRDRSGEWQQIPPPFDPLPGQTDDLRRVRQPKASPAGPGHGRHPEHDGFAVVGGSDV